jgi:penicillin-binding protein 1A
VGIHKLIDVAHRFGVTSNIPAYLPIALGAVEITLEEQVASYSVFPNDGLRVKPRLVKSVSNADGVPLWEDTPQVNEAIDQQTARTMMTLLRAVTQHGTGAAAAQLNHPVGGKTGTTSDYTDAWFLGFTPSVTCGVWVGFDSRQSLGEKETGARAALPIWLAWMKAAIVGKDDEQFLGDEKAIPLLKAAADLPAKPGTATGTTKPSVATPVTGMTVKPVKALAPAKMIAGTASGGSSDKQPAKPAVKPALLPNTGGQPLMKRALVAPTPAKPTPIVRPALPGKPKQ